jgi:hypothetical protein
VKEYRYQLCEFFENITDEAEIWDSGSVIKACGLLVFLEDFETIFLLQAFSGVVSYTDVLCNLLQTKYFDMLYCEKKIKETQIHLNHDRDHSLPSIWAPAVSQKNPAEQRKRRRRSEEEYAVTYKRLYVEIIDGIIYQTDVRFSRFEKLEYFHLLQPSKYEEFKKQFPYTLVERCLALYGSSYDRIGFRNELAVQYASPEFRGKHVYELVRFINENDISSGFSEVYKLATYC